jgi:hypothetical protein
MAKPASTESLWMLRADLVTAKVLIWTASLGRRADLTPETHVYLAHLYDRLSHQYRLRARHGQARRFAHLAAQHYRDGGWDGPPFAAALAMPRPIKWVTVDAVSHYDARQHIA